MKNKLFTFVLVLGLGLILPIFNGVYSDGIDRDEFFRELSEQIDFIRENYYIEVTEEELLKAVTDGLYQSLDPWSVLYTKEEMDAFFDILDDEFVGIGIYLDKVGDHILVEGVIEDSPAEKAGFVKGDKIYFVDGESIADLSLKECMVRLKGEEGSEVSLGYKKSDSAPIKTVKITREKFIIKSAVHSEKDGVDIIKIRSFDEQTYDQFLDIIKSEEFENGLIIDIRDNGGGYLYSATQIADEILQRGKVITTVKYRKSGDEVVMSEKAGITDRVVVLINENSASASELFAGALQDNYRARIIGEKSFGKGVVQQVYPLSYGKYIKLTTGEYLTPQNRNIHGDGIYPEIRVAKDQELLRLSYKFRPLVKDTEFKVGDVDPEIYGIKQRLNYLGADLKLSNVFDDKTLEEVNRVKELAGTYQDGEIDIEFKDNLKTFVNEKAAEVTADRQLERAIAELKE